ncbi:MAG: dephospho-CoA kinase [Treponema sp.]|jgi:dephospho-CoA kinase|nr:dephospho-CoA kinase [Treponema sp.]
MKQPDRLSAPVIIGLTGAYCAGKNHIAQFLEDRGLPVLDVDKAGHEAIELEKNAILERFGTSILGKDGTVDRRLLGARVFGKPEALAALEGIVHPRANELTDAWLDKHQGKPCVINAAVLHKSSVFSRLSFIILVKAPTLIRLFRAQKRDHLAWGHLIKRFNSQKEFAAQYLRKNADIYIVYNSGFWSCLFKGSVERQLDAILSLKRVIV